MNESSKTICMQTVGKSMHIAKMTHSEGEPVKGVLHERLRPREKNVFEIDFAS